jgi:hypothetical protein
VTPSSCFNSMLVDYIPCSKVGRSALREEGSYQRVTLQPKPEPCGRASGILSRFRSAYLLAGPARSSVNPRRSPAG